jgi:hypothetical protein
MWVWGAELSGPNFVGFLLFYNRDATDTTIEGAYKAEIELRKYGLLTFL